MVYLKDDWNFPLDIYGVSENTLRLALRGEYRDIGYLFYELNRDITRYVNGKWYEYDYYKHRWNDGYHFIDDRLVNLFDRLEQNDLTSAQMKQINHLQQIVGNHNSMCRVLRAATKYYNDPDIRFDNKRNLLGFDNGVYDLNTNEFRPGRPEDMIKMSTKYNYDESADIAPVLQIFEDIFPDEQTREYVLILLSSVLYGGPGNLSIFSGLLASGKTTISNMMRCCLGKYYIGVLSIRKNPTWMSEHLRGARLVMCHHPELLKLEIMEEMCIAAEYKLIIMYNTNVTLENPKNPLWNNGRIINFMVKFGTVSDPPYKRLKNVRVLSDIEGMKAAIMNVLLIYWRQYNGVLPGELPRYIRNLHENWDVNDLYYRFLEERTIDSYSTISLNELYNDFNDWHRDNILSLKSFTQGIKKYYTVCKITLNGRQVMGIRGLELKA